MTLPDPRSALYRVARRSGLLVPGFTKRIAFDEAGAPTHGVTYLWGVRIGAFDVRPAREFGQPDDAPRALRYRAWPVVDLLEPTPRPDHLSPGCQGCIRLPGGRRLRFCRFALEPISG